MKTYSGHGDRGLADLISRVFHVGNFLVHVVDNLEILCLFGLAQTLEVGWLSCLLLGSEQVLRRFSSFEWSIGCRGDGLALFGLLEGVGGGLTLDLDSLGGGGSSGFVGGGFVTIEVVGYRLNSVGHFTVPINLNN